MSVTEMPRSEMDVLALATGLSLSQVLGGMGRLTETERNVLELRAPIGGERIPDVEISRRLGLRRKEVRRIADRGAAKLGVAAPGGGWSYPGA